MLTDLFSPADLAEAPKLVCKRGDRIIRQGAATDRLYLLVSGRARLRGAAKRGTNGKAVKHWPWSIFWR